MGTNKEQGSILVYVLLGIVLLGALTIALRNSGEGQSNIDREDAILKAGQVQRYAQMISGAINTMLSNGLSESEIRFAHDDAPTEYGNVTTNPTHQIFGKTGTQVPYQAAPENVNDGSPWEFFATTRVPQVGSDKAELIAVLPNVTQAFCQAVNNQLGFDSSSQPTDSSTGTTPDCVMGSSTQRFTGTYSDTSPNIMDEATFSRLPSLQACVYCASDSSYNYFYVLLAR